MNVYEQLMCRQRCVCVCVSAYLYLCAGCIYMHILVFHVFYHMSDITAYIFCMLDY